MPDIQLAAFDHGVKQSANDVEEIGLGPLGPSASFIIHSGIRTTATNHCPELDCDALEGWKFEGALEVLMHNVGMFDRHGALTTEGFKDSGADWLKRYKPYIEDGKTVVTSPHKVFGPETNDLVLQLRKRGISRVILAGMSANLCTESHLRELLEQGFEVTVVSDGTAAAKVPEGDGYAAAMVNFRFIANDVVSTKEVVVAMRSGK